MSLAGPSVAASPSLRLRRKIDLMVPPYAHACQRLIDHPRLTDLFPEYLISIHSIIRTTVPLMDAAIERAHGFGPGDPVAASVGAYLERHVEEERDHDAKRSSDSGSVE